MISSDVISNISNIAIALSSLVTTVIALATLVLVYYQLRETNRQTRSLSQSIKSSTYQSIVDGERELLLRLSENPKFMKSQFGEYKIVKQYKIHPQEMLNIGLMCAHYENIYFQFRQGVIPKELWPEWSKAIVNNINKPMIVKVWPEVKQWYWKEFSDFVDRELENKKTI